MRFRPVQRLVLCVVAAAGLAAPIFSSAAASSGQVGKLAARLPLAGSLDATFGNGGVVTPVFEINAISVQPDGKIVAAGSQGVMFALARYLPDGSADPGFGTGGYVETDLGLGNSVALALQPDGKIVVAEGSTYGSSDQFTLARYDSNGSPDTTFGTDGSTNMVIPFSLDASWTPWGANVAALAVLSDGKILAAGSARWHAGLYEEYGGFVLARYTPTGSLDPTFGGGGIVETFSGDADLGGIVVLPGGRIVVTGTSYGGHPDYPRKIALARYEPNGSLDFSYPEAAVTTGRLSGGPSALQHGKIVVAGWLQHYKKIFPVVARYGTNGRVDKSFGKHGYAEVTRAQFAPSAVVTQNDGKILLAGQSNSGGTVLRLLPNGRLDRSFGGRGIVSFDPGASSLALQQDGKILVGGQTLDRLISGNNCTVPRLHDKPLTTARSTLRNAYCKRGRVSYRFSRMISRGRIISTKPRRGTTLPGGAEINLIVSRGKPA